MHKAKICDNVNKKHIVIFVVNFITGIIFVTLLFSPLFNRKTPIFYGKTQLQSNINSFSPIGSESENWYIYPELKKGEIYKIPSFNWSKFWKVFKNHALWKLEAWHPVQEQWVNATSLLNINRNYTSNNSCKIGLNFTTPDNGVTTDWRFTLGIDYKVKNYINKSSNYEYVLSYEVWGEPFNVTFNWSDMLQYSGLIFSHGIKNISGNKYFWFRVRRNNIPPNYFVEVDPTYTVHSDEYLYTADINSRNLIRLSNGTFWCCFHRGDTADIYVAWSEDYGETWNPRTVSSVYTSLNPSVCVDSNDVVHLTWRGASALDTEYHIRYCNSSDWSNIRNISYTNSQYYYSPAIAVDSLDNLHVVFERDDAGASEVYYVNSTDNGNSWGTHVAITNEGDKNDDQWIPSIAINSSDSIHVVFMEEDGGPSGLDAVKHMYSDDYGDTWSGWDADLIAGDSTYHYHNPCIVISDDDNLHVIFYNTVSSDACYSINVSGAGWSAIEEIEASATGGSLGTNSNNYVHACYNGEPNLHWAYNNTVSWSSPVDISGFDIADPSMISTQYPIIDGLKTNRPLTGYAVVYSTSDGSNITFNASDDLTWEEAFVNSPPTQTGESPSNNSIGVPIIPNLYVVCSDIDGDTLNATWWSNSSSSWVQFASNNSIANNTNITQPNTNFSDYNQMYWWSVNLSDGEGGWNNETYHFTTNMMIPEIQVNYPLNQSTDIEITPIVNITVWDNSSGEDLTVKWYDNVSSYVYLGNDTHTSGSIPNIEDKIRGSKFTTDANGGFATSITYCIYITTENKNVTGGIYDSNNNLIAQTEIRNLSISAMNWETLNFSNPVYLNPNSEYFICVWGESWTGTNSIYTDTDGSDPDNVFHQDVIFDGTLPSTVSLTADDYEVCRIYANITWTYQQTNLSVSNGTSVEWVYDNASDYSTQYWWKAVVNNSQKSNDSWFTFTTETIGIQFQKVLSFWFSGNNISNNLQVLDLWFSGNNVSSNKQISQFWYKGENTSQDQQVLISWYTGGNITQEQQVLNFWYSGGNISTNQQVLGFWFSGNSTEKTLQQTLNIWFSGDNISNNQQVFDIWFKGDNISSNSQIFINWFSGNNVSNYQNILSFWYNGRNISSNKQILSFWVSGNNVSVRNWQQVLSFWFEGNNVSQNQQVFSSWYSGNNVSSDSQVLQFWYSGGNITINQQVFSCWFVGNNITNNQQILSFWYSGNNISNNQQILQIWYKGGNISNNQQVLSIWFSGGNISVRNYQQVFSMWFSGNNVSTSQQVSSFWYSGDNISSDSQVLDFYFTGGNISNVQQIFSIYFSGGNVTQSQQIISCWFNGNNISSEQNVLSLWYKGGNISSNQQVFSIWFSGGNVTVRSYQQVISCWFRGNNISSNSQVLQLWFSGNNISSNNQVMSFWYSGGNITTNQQITQFWYSGNNISNNQQILSFWFSGDNTTDRIMQQVTSFWFSGNNITIGNQILVFWFSGDNTTVFPIYITNPYPSNNSINAPLQPMIYVTINSTGGQTMNVSWYYGLTEGNENILLGTDNNFVNSTQTELFYPAIDRVTTYYWRVQVDDGTNYVNETFSFRTVGYPGGGTGGGGSTVIGIVGLFGLIGIISIFLRRRGII